MKRYILPIILILALMPISADESSVIRTVSSSTVRCSEVEVTLTVNVNQGETFYAIDEVYPEGWTLIDSGSGDTTEPGHIKWLVLSNAASTQYSYTLQAPCYSFGAHNFEGIYMFEGFQDTVPIAGNAQIMIPEEDCTEVRCLGQNPTDGISAPWYY